MSRRVEWLIGIGLVVVIVIELMIITTWPRDLLETPLIVDEPAKTVDVVIVLGAGTRKNDPNNLPPQAEQRVVKGVSLVQEGFAPRLIVAGGQSPSTGLIEADLMSAYAIERGLGDSQVEEERSSRNTWENATNSIALMKQNGWSSALVVTSPYHTWRACRMFRKQLATVSCIPADYSLVPTTDAYNRFMDNRSVIREYGAIVLAWFRKQL